jgi:hypothetical protein
VEAFAARFRQEDGCRDHKQRLGMEACRAWTKEPVLRTFQVHMVALTLLRLLQFRLDQSCGMGSCRITNIPEGDMPTIKLAIDAETYDRLSTSAVRDLRPIPWQALVLLREALGLAFPCRQEPDERKPDSLPEPAS